MAKLLIAVKAVFWILLGLVVFTTVAPMSGSQEWWIRGWDFPRLHIALTALFAACIGAVILRRSAVVGIVILLACATYQAYQIFPYTRWATKEIRLSTDVPADHSIKVLSSNVLMGNTKYDAVISMIEDEAPDVLFLMETDQRWVDALAPALTNFDTVINYPLDNHYGLIFATNLGVTNAEVVFLSDDKTPSVLADLIAPTGEFFFVGLHPRPPVPGQDTDERDEQIRRAARLADRESSPVVAMGDFNDVAWSYTSQRFKEYGEFKDPRIGRGMLPSFDATSWWMRFPIDQLYVTDGIGLVSFDRLQPIGSDHFPMKAVITINRETPTK